TTSTARCSSIAPTRQRSRPGPSSSATTAPRSSRRCRRWSPASARERSRRIIAMALDLIAELEALVASFERAAIEYALGGGLAVAVHGHPRATMDIDVLVAPDQLANAIRVAREAGFDVPARKMVFGLREGRSREMQRVSKVDPETQELVSLDLIVVGPEL